jgi:hypothetical protein
MRTTNVRDLNIIPIRLGVAKPANTSLVMRHRQKINLEHKSVIDLPNDNFKHFCITINE